MKKYFVLLIGMVVLMGCASMIPPAIRVDNAIEEAGQQYKITANVSVNVSGMGAQNIEDVFSDFGFQISSQADYTVRVESEILGQSRAWGYLIYPVKLRMWVKDTRSGQEYFYKANANFSYHLNYGYSGYNSVQHYPNDPYGLAAKIAATEAIGNFIQEQEIPHRWPDE